MFNPAEYIGIPFVEHGRDYKGVDCWGLVYLVLKDSFDVHVPSYTEHYKSATDAKQLSKLISGEMAPWKQVPDGEEKPGDVALLRLLGRPIHVGVVTMPGMMLHVEEGIDACLDRYTGIRWQKRLIGIFRYKLMMS